MKAKSLVALAVLSTLSLGVNADSLITVVSQDVDGSETSKIYVASGKTAAVNARGQTDFIFDTKKNLAIALNHDDQQYVHVDAEQMQKMAEGLGQMQQQMQSMMEQQMQGMSEEEKAQMREMMGGLMPGGQSKEKVSIKETGKSDKINGYNCKWINLNRGDELLSEACVVSVKDVDMAEEDFATLIGFLDRMSEFASQMGDNDEMMLNQHLLGKKQVPVQIKDYEDGEIEVSTLSFAQKAAPKGVFAIPEGYQQMKMPEMVDY
ncbi:DUF4412 domain-containing protein [Bowmanella pacifica]|uniref:DUF4412 domain-containing protein n=1 Tax=Bowmanella pacifica TaxID=502051 RepID=A0A917Z0N0_9ALTE|nr:DUF4412 domain-containing protein [Bowmanella pacifica]GGO70808.1 hypothetical protein GCM10010982_25200 [Bowmanella pacifica]